jgi:hypothetical protein
MQRVSCSRAEERISDRKEVRVDVRLAKPPLRRPLVLRAKRAQPVDPTPQGIPNLFLQAGEDDPLRLHSGRFDR